ncbi:hypothetical protein DPMN_181045 [Dreissena polymorpha]|uniref:Uncharacterized protein n=1 Tax=Dreissena polymorpha TaxID=45954 RepID=A0A9D4I180_DREPO|nr:hypothetical protein DPMN_181045 [Dreissena polymorpha]
MMESPKINLLPTSYCQSVADRVLPVWMPVLVRISAGTIRDNPSGCRVDVVLLPGLVRVDAVLSSG